MNNEPLQTTAYAAIRSRADHTEWIDTNSLHMIRSRADENAREFDAEFPVWAKYNPIVRIAQFSLKEIDAKGGTNNV